MFLLVLKGKSFVVVVVSLPTKSSSLRGASGLKSRLRAVRGPAHARLLLHFLESLGLILILFELGNIRRAACSACFAMCSLRVAESFTCSSCPSCFSASPRSTLSLIAPSKPGRPVKANTMPEPEHLGLLHVVRLCPVRVRRFICLLGDSDPLALVLLV